MARDLDLGDVVHGYPVAEKELAELYDAAARLGKAEELLKRALRQLSKWQAYYGDVEKLPPAGDVQLAEDAAIFLTPDY